MRSTLVVGDIVRPSFVHGRLSRCRCCYCLFVVDKEPEINIRLHYLIVQVNIILTGFRREHLMEGEDCHIFRILLECMMEVVSDGGIHTPIQ